MNKWRLLTKRLRKKNYSLEFSCYLYFLYSVAPKGTLFLHSTGRACMSVAAGSLYCWLPSRAKDIKLVFFLLKISKYKWHQRQGLFSIPWKAFKFKESDTITWHPWTHWIHGHLQGLRSFYTAKRVVISLASRITGTSVISTEIVFFCLFYLYMVAIKAKMCNFTELPNSKFVFRKSKWT